MKYAAAASLVAVVWAANWALETFGTVPVGFGYAAPAGVFFAGLAFGLRDLLHETGGRSWVAGAIVVGTAVSFIVSDAVSIPGGHTSIAVASGAAFLISETVDFAVYAPLRERQWTAAVVASNLVGATADSLLFLWLAFGSVDFAAGQIIGKTYMTVPAVAAIFWVRRRR